jgi:vacuolar-type H+-ATPase subunit F/Vma7
VALTALSVERILNVVLMVSVFHLAGASVVVVLHVPCTAIPNVVKVSSAVHHLILVVMTEHAQNQVSHVAVLISAQKARNAVVTVNVVNVAVN